MNFQNISPVQSSDILIDMAFNSAKIETSKLVTKGLSETSRQRKKQITKVQTASDKLLSQLKTINTQFPRFDELSDFYKELFLCYMKEAEYKQNLSKIKWAELQIKKFHKKYYGLLRSSNDEKEIVGFTSEFYGRVGSVMKQIAKPLKAVHTYRHFLRQFPAIKDDCVNVALFGFPNVGKSTLLSKLTSANPKIANYAFTTKQINIGYQKIRNIQVQILDTPGTLNRFEQMNDIEKMAYLVLMKLADVVIYVFDPTMSYPIADQEALFRVAEKSKAKIISYVSKKDLVDESAYIPLAKTYGAVEFDEFRNIFNREALKKEKELLGL